MWGSRILLGDKTIICAQNAQGKLPCASSPNCITALPDVDVDPCRFTFLWVRISITTAGESLSVHSESDELTTRSSDGELRPAR